VGVWDVGPVNIVNPRYISHKPPPFSFLLKKIFISGQTCAGRAAVRRQCTGRRPRLVLYTNLRSLHGRLSVSYHTLPWLLAGRSISGAIYPRSVVGIYAGRFSFLFWPIFGVSMRSEWDRC
jgi:hypothetical protein